MNEPVSSRFRVIELDYDQVEVGRTAVRTIEIWNESCVSIFNGSGHFRDEREYERFKSMPLPGPYEEYPNYVTLYSTCSTVGWKSIPDREAMSYARKYCAREGDDNLPYLGWLEVLSSECSSSQQWNNYIMFGFNSSKAANEQIYQVQRDPATNPLDHVFHLRSYTWTLASDEKFICEIRYRPFVAFSKNTDYFNVTDTSGACLKIVTRGSCVGPEVTCSSTGIFMYCTSEVPEARRRIKLTNKSKVAATFMCSIDEKYKPFKLDTRLGVINPCSHKYVTITFVPPEHGRYTYELPVLVLHQEPIIIHLLGYYGLSSCKNEDVSHYCYPWKLKTGFNGYMNDSINTTEDLPPISLSRNYFDFGSAKVDMESVAQRIPHAICLTNHDQTNFLVTWEEDVDGIFNVSPREMQVKASQSVLFELSFNPSVKNNLFGRELVGSVFIDQKIQILFPFVISVRAIGHTFPIGSNGWIPQYEIPQTVIMPPCVPPFPVYTTFLIKKFGHLPLMFQFVPPPASHFTVKPMVGVIYQSYQIIAVEMTPELKDEQIYIDRWTVYFNGNTKNESYIDFRGYAEYANVIFCNNNALYFAPVFPRCQQFEQLGMRNITRHRIKYQFYELPPELTIEHPAGEIDPNDILLQECSFCPSESNVNYDFKLQCTLIVIKNGIVIGSDCSINLRVHGRSETGSLVAMPNELNFGEQEYNVKRTLSFVLFNFSSVNIYYQLICNHRNWPLGDIQKDIQMHPASGTVFAGSHVKIMVSIIPQTRGYYELAIQYFIRLNFRSDTLISGQSPTKLCNASCMCILPTLKVKNLCAYGFNQKYSINISKTFLWSSMQINKLNTILKNIVPGERNTLNTNFFPMINNEGAVVIKLFAMNPSRMPVSWIFKRVYKCSCKHVMKKTNRQFQYEKTECIHEKLCSLKPTTGTLKPNGEAIINIKIHYTLIGKSKVCWDLDIGHDRHIILNILIECMSESEQQCSFLSAPIVKFGRVYFANREAIYKTRWICNVTNEDIPFSVDVDPIRKLNKHYHCEVFSCLSKSGILQARTATILLLKFQPRMFGAYRVTLPVTLGSEMTEFTLEGESCCDYKLPVIRKPIPACCVCKTAVFPAYFSMDCLDMWSMPTYTSIVKMLLMYNNLNYAALAYEWKCQEVSEIIRVEILPRKGVMRPNTVQSFRVKIYSKGNPCRIDLNVPCEFFNATQRRDYQRSIIKHNILSKELEGQFVITEKGTDVPKPWIKILDKPDVYSKMLSLRCYIYPVEDECLKVSLTEELKTVPSNAIYFEKSKPCIIIKEEEELSIVTFVLEGLLWDILHSRRFKKSIEDTLIPERNLYYSQFVMDFSKRRKLEQRSYISPPLKIISSILEKILFIMVHEEFSLETAHLIPEEDARHINYLKTLPKQNRVPVRQEYETFDNLYDKGEVLETYIKAGSRVSFVE